MKKWLFFLFAAMQLSLASAQATVGTLLTDVALDNLTADTAGNLYASNYLQGGVYKIVPGGSPIIYAPGISGAAGSVLDATGKLFVASYTDGNIYQVPAGGGNATLFAALGAAAGPAGLAMDTAGNIYAACSGSQSAPVSLIKKITPAGVISNFATGSATTWYSAGSLAFDPEGNLYVSGFANSKLYKLTPDGSTTTLLATLPGAGTVLGYLRYQDGYLYVTQPADNKVYRVDLQGNATVFAGSGAAGNADGPALQATFEAANGLAFSPGGDTLYISEYEGLRLRYVTGFTTTIHSLALPARVSARIADGKLELHVEGLQTYTPDLVCQLYSLSGHLVYMDLLMIIQGRSYTRVDLPGLPAGVFILVLRQGNAIQARLIPAL